MQNNENPYDLHENPYKTMNIHLDLYENLCETIKIIEIQ